MDRKSIVEKLYTFQDLKYANFQGKLIPNINPETIIGVRTPILRSFAKELSKEDDVGTREFLNMLPHTFFEENQLHAFIISIEKDYDKCVTGTEAFLPYINNWATCDQMSPGVFKKNTARLIGNIEKWIDSDKEYTVRFAIKMLMDHYLDSEFDMIYPEMVSKVKSEKYYVNMMIAWYFATALAKQYDAILPFIENNKLEKWTHNKTIEKAVSSYRIIAGHKQYLKGLRIR